ncbi:MAG: ChaN family lipoprotein, partial [Elusimicrobia bacterium]|nr:ChaN family lipoprotein [Elusimicrobiota bacterium]
MDLPAMALAAGLMGWTPPHVAAPLSAPAPAPRAANGYTAVVAPTGAAVAWDALIDALMPARVIAAGEKHDEASHHLIQARVLDAVAARDGNVVVGLEMVSQDQQGELDGFLSGKTTEQDFAAFWNKAWGYDYAMYKPIFDVARARHLKVVGLNAPIAVAIAVAKKGLAGLTPSERAWLPASVSESADARYRQFVKESLAGHKLPPEAEARMTQAQAVWNETMGAKAAELAATARVFVIAGQGHMLWRAGIPESAARRGAGPAAVVLPYPLDGEVLPLPDALA